MIFGMIFAFLLGWLLGASWQEAHAPRTYRGPDGDPVEMGPGNWVDPNPTSPHFGPRKLEPQSWAPDWTRLN